MVQHCWHNFLTGSGLEIIQTPPSSSLLSLFYAWHLLRCLPVTMDSYSIQQKTHISSFFFMSLMVVYHNKEKVTNTGEKQRNHIILMVNIQVALNKIQHSFMIKTLKKIRIEEIYFSVINFIYDKYIPIVY